MLNENIRTLRKRMGLTQVELAERLNVSQSTITSWENGTRRPDLDLLPAIAQIFGVSVDVLIGNNPVPIVSNDPWDVEAAFSDMMQDEKFRVLARGMAKMSPEKRENLLSGFLMMFRSDFDEEGNKKE